MAVGADIEVAEQAADVGLPTFPAMTAHADILSGRSRHSVLHVQTGGGEGCSGLDLLERRKDRRNGAMSAI
ncbi:hypothetical protein DPV78_007433 [Talaromyces pinophilus]|nr:hypothetical protein DPV78_007433 [Talaromyces pinophilus]